MRFQKWVARYKQRQTIKKLQKQRANVERFLKDTQHVKAQQLEARVPAHLKGI